MAYSPREPSPGSARPILDSGGVAVAKRFVFRIFTFIGLIIPAAFALAFAFHTLAQVR
jgi:hypothetical protein